MYGRYLYIFLHVFILIGLHAGLVSITQPLMSVFLYHQVKSVLSSCSTDSQEQSFQNSFLLWKQISRPIKYTQCYFYENFKWSQSKNICHYRKYFWGGKIPPMSYKIPLLILRQTQRLVSVMVEILILEWVVWMNQEA